MALAWLLKRVDSILLIQVPGRYNTWKKTWQLLI
jgi:hypothetical protein